MGGVGVIGRYKVTRRGSVLIDGFSQSGKWHEIPQHTLKLNHEYLPHSKGVYRSER